MIVMEARNFEDAWESFALIIGMLYGSAGVVIQILGFSSSRHLLRQERTLLNTLCSNLFGRHQAYELGACEQHTRQSTAAKESRHKSSSSSTASNAFQLSLSEELLPPEGGSDPQYFSPRAKSNSHGGNGGGVPWTDIVVDEGELEHCESSPARAMGQDGDGTSHILRKDCNTPRTLLKPPQSLYCKESHHETPSRIGMCNSCCSYDGIFFMSLQIFSNIYTWMAFADM
jgi:hypothetical protein